VSDIKPLNLTTKTHALIPAVVFRVPSIYIALAYLAAMKYWLRALGGAHAP